MRRAHGLALVAFAMLGCLTGCKSKSPLSAVKNDAASAAAELTAFDLAIARAPGGKIPRPFSKLIAHLSQFAKPVGVLAPIGRSLQRGAGMPNPFADPRRIVAFEGRGPVKDGPNLNGRLFLGYVKTARQIEVIAYNEQRGEFAFQIISDYLDDDQQQGMALADGNGGDAAPKTDGSTPKTVEPTLSTPKRDFCIACHQGGGPIFPRADWSEFSGTKNLGDLIRKYHPSGEVDGIQIAQQGSVVHSGGLTSFAVENSVRTAEGILAANRVWNNLCPDDKIGCRGQLARGVLCAALCTRNVDCGGEKFQKKWGLPPAIPGLAQAVIANWDRFDQALTGSNDPLQIARDFVASPEFKDPPKEVNPKTKRPAPPFETEKALRDMKLRPELAEDLWLTVAQKLGVPRFTLAFEPPPPKAAQCPKVVLHWGGTPASETHSLLPWSQKTPDCEADRRWYKYNLEVPNVGKTDFSLGRDVVEDVVEIQIIHADDSASSRNLILLRKPGTNGSAIRTYVAYETNFDIIDAAITRVIHKSRRNSFLSLNYGHFVPELFVNDVLGELGLPPRAVDINRAIAEASTASTAPEAPKGASAVVKELFRTCGDCHVESDPTSTAPRFLAGDLATVCATLAKERSNLIKALKKGDEADTYMPPLSYLTEKLQDTFTTQVREELVAKLEAGDPCL